MRRTYRLAGITLHAGPERIVHVIDEHLRSNLEKGTDLPLIGVRSAERPDEYLLWCRELRALLIPGKALAGTGGRGICILRTSLALDCRYVTVNPGPRNITAPADGALESAVCSTRSLSMAGVKVVVGGKRQDEYPLSFNDIKNKKGMYQHRNGKILIVYTNKSQFIRCDARQTRTGFTRTGMAMVDRKTGGLRLVVCDQTPDGDKNWKVFEDTVTLAGNPHVVPATAQAGQVEAADDDTIDEDNDN